MKEVPFSGVVRSLEDEAKHRQQKSRSVRHVRTYRDDVAHLIERKKITRTHVAIAEEERRRAIGQSSVWEGPKPTSFLPLIIAGIFMLIGVSLIFYDLAGEQVRSYIFPAPTQIFVIPGDTSQMVSLENFSETELVKKLETLARKEKITQGTYLRLGFTARTGTTSLPLPVRNFFRIIGSEPPDEFLRSIDTAYEGGLVSAGELKGYLVFTTTFYENTVVGLLDWEGRLMSDLYPVIDPLRAGLSLPISEGSWRTQVWNGMDLRVFETNDGRIAMTYGWIDKTHLIITGNIQSFAELSHALLATSASGS